MNILDDCKSIPRLAPRKIIKIPSMALLCGELCRGKTQITVPKKLPTFTKTKAKGKTIVRTAPTAFAIMILRTRANQFCLVSKVSIGRLYAQDDSKKTSKFLIDNFTKHSFFKNLLKAKNYSSASIHL